ncbi:hypothetical protein NliqN6_0409 [Naganishia liquefaciens]|uniref:Uncharacterized protein n=1 Tax=Naganishia liquefaciens TaxID=104408 RepID=A0A8H3TMY2_9TREE|nr:hypothetical protein NliqN6_0409 [Naganishia liquefaciens]
MTTNASRPSRSTTWPSVSLSDRASAGDQLEEKIFTSSQSESPTLPHGWKAKSQWWTWNCFTVNMGTGGVAILIGGCPFAFNGQRVLGTIFFFIDVVIFLINIAGVTSRAIYHPRTFKSSFYDHEDGIYVPCIALAFATLFVCVIDYAVPYVGQWLVTVLQVVWLAYAAVGLVIAMIMEYTVRGSLRPLSAITPADCLLVFPLMLGGTTGSALAAVVPESQATYIIVLSYMLQGMGWFLSLMKLSVWMCRSILLPTPPPESIFQFLMAVGPPGFTAFGKSAWHSEYVIHQLRQLAFMNLARSTRNAFPAAGLLDAEGARIFQVISLWYSLPLLGLALYLWVTPLVLYTIGTIKIRKFRWTMSFWSLTFPSTGMFMASAQLGEQLPSKTFNIWISKTLLRPKAKRPEDIFSYHGLHQGEVFEDGNHVNVNVQRMRTRQQDIENGETPSKRYIAEFSNGA